VLTWIDTEGRTITELRSRMGDSLIFKSAVMVERHFADGLEVQKVFPFTIPGTCIEEAFANFDAAKDAAEKAGWEALDREHTRASLAGELPLPPRPQLPIQLPPTGPQSRRRKTPIS
jgi:hypothetical protein